MRGGDSFRADLIGSNRRLKSFGVVAAHVLQSDTAVPKALLGYLDTERHHKVLQCHPVISAGGCCQILIIRIQCTGNLGISGAHCYDCLALVPGCILNHSPEGSEGIFRERSEVWSENNHVLRQLLSRAAVATDTVRTGNLRIVRLVVLGYIDHRMDFS